MSEKMRGKIKWFCNQRGYGFLCKEGDDAEYFVHYSAIVIEGYKTLAADQEVTFVLKETDKGIQAADVTPV